MSQYASLNDRSLIAYEDFVSNLEAEEANRRNKRSDQVGGQSRGHVVDGDGFDGLSLTRQLPRVRSSNQHEDEPATQSPWRRPDNLTKLRDSVLYDKRDENRRNQQYTNEDLDAGSDSYYDDRRDAVLAPPKVSDSINAFPTRRGQQPSRQYYGGSSVDQMSTSMSSTDSGYWNRLASTDNRLLSGPRFNPRASTGPRATSISPSKVGSAMWGKNTPMHMKGKPLKLHEDMWCCAVCLYMDNPVHSPKCAVCESPNYGERKVCCYYY